MSTNVFGATWCDDANNQLCYLMEADEDPLTDSSQNTNTGVLKAAGEPNFVAVGCAEGSGCYDFDGSDDFVRSADNASMDHGAGDFSFGAAFDPVGTAFGTDGLVGKGDSVANTGRIIRVDGGNLQCRLLDSASYSANMSGAPEGAGYFYVACTRCGDNLTLYVNGSSVGTDTGVDAVDVDTATGFSVGARNAGGTMQNFYEGLADEVFDFDTCLNVTQINSIMNNGLGAELGAGRTRRVSVIN